MKKLYIFLGLAVLVIFIFWLIFKDKNPVIPTNQESVPVGETSTTTLTTTDSATTTSSSTEKLTLPPKTGSVKPVASPLSATQKYLDALKIYKSSGYYFQFVSCHGLPGSQTLKKGKKFMLDNRDNVSRKIAIVGGQSFKIAPYNYAIATAPSTVGVHYITCDGGGAASIKVQP